MVELLEWTDVSEVLDGIEVGDRKALIEVFERFEGRAINRFDGRGARQTVNISSFCHRFGFHRAAFAGWLRKYGETRKETA